MEYEKMCQVADEANEIWEQIKPHGYSLEWDFTRSDNIKLIKNGRKIGTYPLSRLKVQADIILGNI